MESTDYYQILEVNESADIRQIKTAYRELALKYHPDRNRDHPEMGNKMKAINEAYAVLSNVKKRHEYDTLRKQYGSSAHRQFRNNYSEQDIFNGSDINRIFEEMARDLGLRGVDEIFREFYGKGYRTFEFKRPGIFVRGSIFIGGLDHRSRRLPQMPVGGYLGKLSRFLFRKISGGDLPQAGSDLYDVIRPSSETARQGAPYAYFLRERKKKLVVKIPPGVRQGQQIRLAGMGLEGRGGGKAGDLYLTVKIQRSLLQQFKKIRSNILKKG